MKSKVLEYKGRDITVSYDVARCIHAATCVKRLPAVFDVQKKPWVQPDHAEADAVATVVARCPTGALHSERVADVHAEEAPTTSSVRVSPDGPLFVHARTKLQQLSGGALLEDTRMALCRCGASQNKPLCDNAHREAGFRDGGALGKAAGDGADASEHGDLTVSAAPNGPLLLDGSFVIHGSDGAEHRARKAALCRCGLSGNKPYCDGSHATGGFRAE
ncbi:MAG: hypothetical protein GC160_10875 [Acidobacteria bacterium]|nr:hypothetical protein [Acidobacteriota bacterium]